MILHTTLSYRANVLGPRQRNAQDRTFSERLSVEVGETTASELPVAFRWKERDRHDEPGVTRKVRWDGEDLWQPIGFSDRTRHDYRPVAPRDAEWLLAHCDHHAILSQGASYDPLCLRTSGHRAHGAVYTLIDEDATVNRIKATTRDHRVAEVRAAASRLMLVDGLVYAKCPEPVHHLRWENTRGDGFKMAVEVMLPKATAREQDTWRVDEVEHMNLACDLMDGSRERLVEVLIPEAVRAPLVEAELVRSCQLAMKEMAEHLQFRDADFFSAFARVRDLGRPVSDALAAGVDADGMELSLALAEALPHLTSLRPASDSTFSTLAEDAVRKAVARYDHSALVAAFAPDGFGP